MNTGYSNKIYKKKKKSFPLPVLIALIGIILVYLLIKPGKNNDPVPVKATPEIKAKKVQIKPEIVRKEVKTELGSSETSVMPSPKYEKTDPDSIEDSTLTPNEIKNLEGRALVYIKSRNYSEALSVYQELLFANEKYLTSIGMCYYWMKEYENAIENLENSLEQDYFPFINRKFLAFSYYETDDLSRSREFADEALKIRSDKELEYLIRKLEKEEEVMEDYKDQGLENFVIKFDKSEHSDTRLLVSDHLKEAYRTVGKEMDFFPDTSFTVILYNEKNFFDVTRAPGWAGGLFDGKIRIPVRGVSDNTELLKRVIFHEYSHALVSEITKKCPRWIDEGLAEYFSNENLKNIGQIIPLRKLERGFPSGNAMAVSVAYQESYAAVSYLIDKYGLYSMKELLIEFGNGKSLNNAFKSVFYISYDTFVDSWGKNS
ncbi:MAG: hypothetical protein ABFR75_07040 [Acidobacteriota bacterium]